MLIRRIETYRRWPRSFKLNDQITAEAMELSQTLRKVPSKWPLLLRMLYRQRFPMVVVGLLLGMSHGVVNSCGRFLALRTAIAAVVEDAPFPQRLRLAFLIAGVIAGEGILLWFAKHFFVDHVANFVTGRMSILVAGKISRVGHRPLDVNETNYISSDIPQLLQFLGFMVLLPSGVTCIFSGFVVLVVYLGWSGVAGLATLSATFILNMKLAGISKKADKVMQSKLDNRTRTMKQVLDSIKAIKFYGKFKRNPGVYFVELGGGPGSYRLGRKLL